MWDWQDAVVLLVEDDPGDAVLVEELVADSGVDIRLVWVRSLAEARAWLASGHPDCVVLDLNLPDAHGLHALARVQDHLPGVAVVVLTGLAEEGTGLAAVAAGAQDYLVKGRTEPELFGRAVRYAIQRKQTEHTVVALQAGQLRAQENARLERGLLPRPLLRGPRHVDVVARYRPGRAQALLGGDFYDVVQTPDGGVHALIGDVCGHGPDEAALGVALRIAWRTLILTGVRGPRQLQLLENLLLAERASDEVFATVTSLELPPPGGLARVLRAGHPGLLLRTGQAVDWVEVPGGPALGMLPEQADWTAHDIVLPDDTALVFFTDGLYEGRCGPHRQRLGHTGLLHLARTLSHHPPERFVDTLIAHVETLANDHGGLDDDIAVVHLHASTLQPAADHP